MNKKMLAMSVVFCALLGVLFSFQNCGEQMSFNLMEAEASSAVSVDHPISLSGDVTQISMKLTSDDEMELESGDVVVEMDLENNNFVIEDKSGEQKHKMTKEESSEVMLFLRLVRKIKISQEDCNKKDLASLSNDEIFVNTNNQEVSLGKYNNCQSDHDLALTEKKSLKRLVFKMIQSRKKNKCLKSGLVDPPICKGGSVYKKVFNKNQCLVRYKCIPLERDCKALKLTAPICPDHTSLQRVMKDGCHIGYKCDASILNCPVISAVYPKCTIGSKVVPVKNESMCVVGYKCEEPKICPTYVKDPFELDVNKCIESGGKVIPYTDSNGCQSGVRCEKKDCKSKKTNRYNAAQARQCITNGSNYTKVKDKDGCVVDYRCKGQCKRRLATSKERNKCKDDKGVLKPTKNKQGCITGYTCEKNIAPVACPVFAFTGLACGPGYKYEYAKDKNGCVISRECVPEVLACPDKVYNNIDASKMNQVEMASLTVTGALSDEALECRPGFHIVNKTDDKGCGIGQECVPDKLPCVEVIPAVLPFCKPGFQSVAIKNKNNCTTGFECKPLDCAPITLPAIDFCSDGEQIAKVTDHNNCVTGYKCEKNICPTLSLPSSNFCKSGERFSLQKDKNGCDTHICLPVVCPEQIPPPEGYCKPGERTYPVKDAQGCVSYKCSSPVACPTIAPPEQNFCKSGEKIKSYINEDGCRSYRCEKDFIVCTAQHFIKPECKSGHTAIQKIGKHGCQQGWECKKIPDNDDKVYVCPIIAQGYPLCKSPKRSTITKDKNGCITGYGCELADAVTN